MSTIQNILIAIAILLLIVASYAAFWIIVLLIVGFAIFSVVSVIREEDTN